MKRTPIKHRHSYFMNPVSLTLGALMLLGGLTLWSAGPSLLVRVESNRVLKSTIEKFIKNRPRYLENEEALDQLHLAMKRNLYAAKVTDPDMEAWLEIDDQGHIHLGVIYDAQTKWPLGIVSPSTFTVRQEQASSDSDFSKKRGPLVSLE